MNKVTHKRLYHWHSLAGLITTLLLIALCFTALPAIFLKDISYWLTPTQNVSLPEENNLTFDQWIAQAGKTLPITDEFHLRPKTDQQSPTIWMKVDDAFTAFSSNESGEFTPHSGAAAVYTLAHAHYDFLIPAPYGEYLVGLVGLSMLALVFMGVLLHKKWRKEKNQLRKNRSKRLLLSDIHKLLGLWLLPFHLFISYTGAVLGLGSLLLIVAALSAFNGDKDAAVAAVIGEEPVMTGEVCPMLSVDKLAEKADLYWANKYGPSHIVDIEIHGLTDCNAQITIASEIPGYLLSSNSISYSMVTGEVRKIIDWIPSGFGERWYALISPLHFGTFAGYLSQWLYALSALLLALMTISGMLLWLDKNREEKNNSSDIVSRHGFIKACFGIALGVSTSTVIVLMLAKLSPAFDFNFGYRPTVFSLIYAVVFAAVFLNIYYVRNAISSTLAVNSGLYLFLPILSWALFGLQSEHLALECALLTLGLLYGYGCLQHRKKAELELDEPEAVNAS